MLAQLTNPLALDGSGIKGEGDSKTVPPHRHSRVGGNPQGGEDNDEQPSIPPLS